MDGTTFSSGTIIEKVSTSYKTTASPIRCPLCGGYPEKPISEMQPNNLFRCRFCGQDYIINKSLDEKTINQMINSILKDFSSAVTEEIKNNIGQMIIFYHQNLVNEIEKQMQDQKDITFALIQNAYRTVDQYMFTLLEIRNNLKTLSSKQTDFMSKTQEQYQILVQQTQLIVDLIRQRGGNHYGKPASMMRENQSVNLNTQTTIQRSLPLYKHILDVNKIL